MQKILVGQTFLSGKAINSEIIIDDIAVVDDKTDDTILGEVRNIKRNDGTSTEVVVGFKIFPTIGIL
jgi:hypothetical protein